MSNLQSGADKAQMIELLNSIKMPVLGAGGGFAPIGTINSYMGTVAPIGWLVCDGQTYNISDYPDLATHIASQFGSVDFFGGDGTTTFGVPDLRGEFLRGSGTNSHTNQGDGANVGVHQDGTGHIQFKRDTNFTMYGGDTAEKTFTNQDSQYGDVTGRRYLSLQQYGSDAWKQYFTSRPTNTSVLFIIKATISDANLDAYTVYSPNEHQVGWWQEEVDGVLKQKPVYEKTITISSLSATTNILHNISDFGRLVKLYGTFNNNGEKYNIPDPSTDKNYSISTTATSSQINLFFGTGWSSYLPSITDASMTIQYTKTTDHWQTS